MFKTAWLILILGISLSSSRAQGNELVVMGPVKASRLAGVVKDLTGAPIENVLVSSFDCGIGEFRGMPEFKSLEKVVTDERGRFRLNWPKSSTVCIQFLTPGMDLLQMQIRKSPIAGELHPKLKPGT